MTKTIVTKKTARKVLELVDYGLTSGLGKPKPGQMCIMAVINHALGNKHGDKPSCVHPVIRSFDITLNDVAWSSNEARAKGMRREAIAKLGSTEIDGQAWAKYVAEQTIRLILPKSLRFVAELIPDYADSLNEAAIQCEKDGSASAASAARSAAWSAEGAARSAAWSAESAEGAAWSAARSAEERDEILSLAAEIATDACIKFKTQGSKWLDITD